MRDSWATDEAVRSVMRGNKGRDTKPELRVRSLVHAAGLRYRVSARPLLNHRTTADLVFRPARVAVFIDGCFWHGCPEHYRPSSKNVEFWSAKLTENRARDARTQATLANEGWLGLRFWEHEDPRAVAESIVVHVQARRPRPRTT